VKKVPLQLAGFSLWGIGVILGLALLARHQNTPGEPVRPAGESSVEKAVAALSKDELRPFLEADSPFTLILLAHPRCPCTRATLHELERLVPHLGGKAALHAYFAIPAGKGEDFAEGDNLKLARSIPGMKITLAPASEITDKLGAGTSGQVLVFDHGGRLKFTGGITPGRGHEGSNPGAESIRRLVETGATSLATTPVYGCSLREVRTIATTATTRNPS
jgi:hypothetical protein